MKIVARGTHYPLGATLTPDRRQLRASTRSTPPRSSCCFSTTPDGDPTDVIHLESATSSSGTRASNGIKAGPTVRLQGARRVPAGVGPSIQRRQAAPGSVREGRDGEISQHRQSAARLRCAARCGRGVPDTRDNTAIVPKGIVIDDAFDWQGDESPDLRLEQLVIYEVHVKGFTAHPSSGVRIPGTYLGFIEKIPHLTKLGINAVELLPVHECYVDDFLLRRD